MDGGAWWAAVHWVVNTLRWLSDFTFTFHFYALEKEMATHSSVLAWRIPGTEVPGGLPSMGSHRVGHVWSDLAAAAGNSEDHILGTKIHNKEKWVFPGAGGREVVELGNGYSFSWGRWKSFEDGRWWWLHNNVKILHAIHWAVIKNV